MEAPGKLLVKGGLVYDHDGDIGKPERADILIEGRQIAAVQLDLAPERTVGAEVIDASDHLIIPGLFNAHYHSHDTLCRGLFEELPLEMWLTLYTTPLNSGRSKEEVRLRTLVGGLECVRAGITTVQDMLGLNPQSDEYVDVVLDAYESLGLRVVFSPMVSDRPAVNMMAGGETLPADIQALIGTSVLDPEEQLDFLEHQIQRYRDRPTVHWAVAPIAPQRCTPELLAGCADLAEQHDLAVYTHVYETRGQRVLAQEKFGGSFIAYLRECGLLNHRLSIAHGVWIDREELKAMVAADAGAVLNPVSNMKLKSGIAPVRDLQKAGLRVAFGCDNCSGSDVQNLFQAMKAYCLIAAVSDPEPRPGLAGDALRIATLGGARSALLDEHLGAITPGRIADLTLVDLHDTAYLPYNSAARQLVYSESGRGVATVIIDGRVIMQDRKVRTIDEDALREEVKRLMPGYLEDYERIRRTREPAAAHLLELHRRTWRTDVGLERFVSPGRA